MGEKDNGTALAAEHRELARVMQPKTMDEALALADRLAESNCVPEQYKKKPGDILIAMALGSELGIHWTQALNSIWIANGKPSIYGDMGLALVEASGLLEYKNEWDDPTVDGGTAYCEVKRKGKPQSITRSFSMAQAEGITFKTANGGSYKLTQKDTWRNYGWRMRRFRALWLALRDEFADVLKGVVGREEMEEVDITPTDPQSELPSAQEAEPRAMDVAVATAEEASAKAAEIEKWIAEASADDILHGFDTLFDKMDGLPEETVSALVEKFNARKKEIGLPPPPEQPELEV
jgi:hypothetical protein